MKATAFLPADPQRAHVIWSELWKNVKALTYAGHKLQVTVEPERRSLDANAKFHAICSDLEHSKLPWFGKPRDAAAWKVLLVSGHAVATKEGADIIPGLEGEMVNIRESTALMSRARSASLIEYALAYCAANGVETQEPQEQA
jgi:hypothetical protein